MTPKSQRHCVDGRDHQGDQRGKSSEGSGKEGLCLYSLSESSGAVLQSDVSRGFGV
jgi:hypothetical protein